MFKRLGSYFLTGCWTIATINVIAPPVSAQLFNSAVDQLPASDRASLRSGQPTIAGEKGKYTARVLVKTSADVAWAVLTDYSNFSKFLPNVVSSKILESNGDRKVVEQIDSRQVFLVSIQSRVRSAITEKAKTRIDFQLVDGDLQSLKGYWMVEPIASFTGAKPTQVLITQVVEAQPKAGTPKDVFYNIFKSSLSGTMGAIGREVGRRAQ
jgi:ribosome-associated toxin RatA of RatAB toxin-antitoxin module